MSSTKSVPAWTRKTPGQYGSNGINSDGSLMNVGNKLSDRPSIKLFPQYNSGDTMRALLADCGGLGEGLGDEAPPSARPAAIDENEAAVANAPTEVNTIKFQRTKPAAGDQFQSTFEFGTASPVAKGEVGEVAAGAGGAAPKKKDEETMTVQEAQRNLWEGARQGNTKLVKQALAFGADPTVPNPTDGWLALHYAAAGKRRLTCQVLLQLPSAAKQCATRSIAGETPASLCKVEALAEQMKTLAAEAR